MWTALDQKVLQGMKKSIEDVHLDFKNLFGFKKSIEFHLFHNGTPQTTQQDIKIDNFQMKTEVLNLNAMKFFYFLELKNLHREVKIALC